MSVLLDPAGSACASTRPLRDFPLRAPVGYFPLAPGVTSVHLPLTSGALGGPNLGFMPHPYLLAIISLDDTYLGV